MVSSNYLQKVDPQWESKVSPLGPNLWKGYGSSLQPKGSYTTHVTVGHPRGNIRCRMTFAVMANDNLPNYFIVGIDNIRLFGIKLDVCGDFFTIGRNLKRDFQSKCTREARRILSLSTQMDSLSITAQPEVEVGDPTPEPEEFKEALKEAHWDKALSLEDKEEILEVIHQFPRVFAHGSRKLGDITTEMFDIGLTIKDGEHPPCLQKKAYPASPQRKKDIEANIQELLALGVIEPVECTPKDAIVSPVLIKYQNDKARLCGDFRSLNDYTVSDIYSIPRIDAVIHGLKGATRISVLNEVKGYHQMRCTDRASNYLHIITHCGVYKYVRMPFGPKNGPSCFQRAMDKTFPQEICDGWVTVYIDDIIVHSSSNKEHVEHLRDGFIKLEQINMTLSLKKCHFAFTSVRVLGHIVSGLMMSVDQNKIKAIQAIPPPKDLGEVQSFLGMCGHYRQYIKDFSTIALPLSKLTRKNEGFEWTEERHKAFETLKKLLMEAPSLALPDFDRPFILYTGASLIGLGAALHQLHMVDQKMVELPVCWISRALRNAELRYGATQLECLAVVWALEKLHYYLEGTTFELVTDCQAVKSLLGMKTPNRHMFRWQLAIQEYRGRMKISHRAGKLHQNADLLSRFPLPNDIDNPGGVEDVGIIEVLGLYVVDVASEF